MRGYIREQIARHVHRLGGLSAAHQDAMYATQLRFIEAMLTKADIVMEDEGVSEETRRRVIRGVIYGSPDPEEAEQRIQAFEAQVRAATLAIKPRRLTL